MLQSPDNHLIVKFKTKYIKNMSTILKLSEIQNAASVSAADCANIVCEVVSAPARLSEDYKDFSIKDIRSGDVAIVAYDVIYNFNQTEPEEEPSFKNQFFYLGEEYFVCHIRSLYAIVRDGNVRMQNGYLMVEDISPASHIYLPQHLRKKINCGKGVVTKVGYEMKNEKPINIQSGDNVLYNKNKLRIYQVNEKPFGILKQSQILAREDVLTVTGLSK